MIEFIGNHWPVALGGVVFISAVVALAVFKETGMHDEPLSIIEPNDLMDTRTEKL